VIAILFFDGETSLSRVLVEKFSQDFELFTSNKRTFKIENQKEIFQSNWDRKNQPSSFE